MERCQWAAGWLLVLALVVMPACSAAPYDRVPRGDWSYDILARWAADGVLSDLPAELPHAARSFLGDEPLTRETMAQIVAAAVDRVERLSTSDRLLLAHLVREYAPELERDRHDPQRLLQSLALPAAEDVELLPVWGLGSVRLRLGHSSDDGGTVRTVYRAAALTSPNRYLLGALSLTNARQLDSTHPAAFPDMEHALVRLHTRFADWELGKVSRRWGPGWGGTMLLSDDAPSLLQLGGRKRLSLGFLGRDYTLEQFVASLNDTGGRRYIVARRLSRPFGRRAGASISESVKTASTRDLPLALVLPLYAYAAIAFDEVQNSSEVNYLAGLDIWYAPGDGVRVYADLFLDDITAPLGLGDRSVPRKIGMQFGIHLPRLNGGRTDVRLEWALTDGERPGSSVHEGGTYVHRNPTLSWFHNDLPIGHRMGQNRRGPFARVRHRFSRRFTVIGEWEDERQWRQSPPVGDRRRLVLYGAYDPKPDRSLIVRMERTGGALGRDTLWELQVAYAF